MRIALALLTSALLAAACAEVSAPPPEPEHNQSQQNEIKNPECTVELRSWIVLGRGRHLYLDCDCPEPFTHLNRRIEYTKITLRTDHDSDVTSYLDQVYDHQNPHNKGASGPPKNDQSGEKNPSGARRNPASNIARMTPGRRLYPIIADENDRLETTYILPVETVESLQHDRIFSLDYALFGPNSNSGVRKVMEEEGLRLPPRILAAEGALGEFPGISMDPGDDVPPDRWPDLGVPDGPVQVSVP